MSIELDITKKYYLCHYLGCDKAEVLSSEELLANIQSGDWGNEKEWELRGKEVSIHTLVDELEHGCQVKGYPINRECFMSNCGTATLRRIF
tara:strand:- start:96 stop:368 length:273 start_codon:yes stop_codon:yes gene_type:complete